MGRKKFNMDPKKVRIKFLLLNYFIRLDESFKPSEQTSTDNWGVSVHSFLF